ncbi:Serine/threonine-protein kinase gad8 [Neonectria ditissima]|uniref:non-specific serine/threonine protein kinase n=1 Tax=Neonectria ditissima TaxID=78410 RepID=A0A0P7ATG7_9HYPO|nr:Serine/threonine-protein kinase gad8 [Neonectria ditissima]
MSWNLKKKLKETHLGSFSSFSKSTSVSSTPEADKNSKAASSSSPDGLATPRTSFNAVPEPVPETPKPGILILTLHEARGLALPVEHQNVFFPSPQHPTSRSTSNVLNNMATNSSSLNPSSRTSTASTNGSGWPQPSPGPGFKGTTTTHGRISGDYMPYALVGFDKAQVFINSNDGGPENPQWAETQHKFDVLRVSELTVHLFFPNPNAAPGSGRTQDIFLGVARLTPRLGVIKSLNTDEKANKNTQRGFQGTGWFDLQQGKGKLRITAQYAENQGGKLAVNDFELLKLVGKGSFGKVYQVRKRDTNCIYAMKSIQKAKIISRAEVTHTLAERSVLAQINSPFIVPLKFSFQSPEKLYFVLAFVNGGELFYHLTNERRFDVNRALFYTAELLCALECLRGFNVIYRDLKPENILLDYQGHIALCDFGLCKLEMKDDDRTDTFCGTPEYLAPELLLGQGYNKSVDWWTLGVLLYEMLTGLPPFYDESTQEMYGKILTAPLSFPSNNIVPLDAKDLLMKLLNRDPAQRLGANGPTEIKAHPFFRAIDWRKLLERKYEPTFKPNVVSNALDTSNIAPEFTEEAPQDSLVDHPDLSQTVQDQFAGFSYIRPVAGLHDAGGSIKDPSIMDRL